MKFSKWKAVPTPMESSSITRESDAESVLRSQKWGLHWSPHWSSLLLFFKLQHQAEFSMRKAVASNNGGSLIPVTLGQDIIKSLWRKIEKMTIYTLVGQIRAIDVIEEVKLIPLRQSKVHANSM